MPVQSTLVGAWPLLREAQDGPVEKSVLVVAVGVPLAVLVVENEAHMMVVKGSVAGGDLVLCPTGGRKLEASQGRSSSWQVSGLGRMCAFETGWPCAMLPG